MELVWALFYSINSKSVFLFIISKRGQAGTRHGEPCIVVLPIVRRADLFDSLVSAELSIISGYREKRDMLSDYLFSSVR